MAWLVSGPGDPDAGHRADALLFAGGHASAGPVQPWLPPQGWYQSG